jgi:cyanophycinase-like exopeptidase
MRLGALILHGGGEALPGDEPVALEALRLAADATHAAAPEPTTASVSGPSGRAALQIVILPLATARGNPARTTAHVAAFLADLANDRDLAVELAGAPVVDRTSADDPATSAVLAAADLIVIPGGDPDLLPTVLPDTKAWQAILDRRRQGAVIWGASAGAMALATWCWTPTGGLDGLGLVPGLVVAPHVADPVASEWLARLANRPPDLGVLTLAERTAVIGPVEAGVGDGSTWRCAGAGVAAWFPPGSAAPAALVRDGGLLRLP